MKLKGMKNKRKGFTLIELIVAMAIVAVLSVAMIPKVAGYIEEGKKTAALESARQVVLAVETYNITSSTKITEDDAYSDFKSKLTDKGLLDSDIKYIGDEITYSSLYKIVKGKISYTIEDEYIVDGKAVESVEEK